MLNEINRIKVALVLIVIIVAILFDINRFGVSKEKEYSRLVIFGDNISSSNTAFYEDDTIYLAFDTIQKFIDEDIFYDKVANKVIITTSDNVLKFKFDDKKVSKNLEYVDFKNPMKLVSKEAYIPLSELKDIYDLDMEYNESTNTITIDKKNNDMAKIKYNKVKVYSDISTKSKIIDVLNMNDELISYTKNLSHARWSKVKTNSGAVGYIVKTNMDLEVYVESNIDNSNNVVKEKINMFWQYGSNLETLGLSKIEGVNVVSPTWYELKNSKGEISSKYSSSYIAQAKSYGYKVWPIITNGIDSTSYTPADTSAMLNSEYNREQFIKNILEIVEKDKLDGINVDFESMKTEDRTLYTQFIKELAPLLRKKNVTLSVDTYFVAYIDRKGVGKAADYIILMGYDQRGAWSNTSGSISEVSWVEGNVKSLIEDSKIPADKIILGVPFYTRLWSEKSGDLKPSTKIFTMKDCLEYIKTNNLTPVFDEDAGQNYVEHKKGDVTYKLWIEDSTSIAKRIDTIKKYNLSGIAGWRKGLETSDVWKTINDKLFK